MAHAGELAWGSTDSEIGVPVVAVIERALQVRFPADYVQCARKNHGGYPNMDVLDFEGHKGAAFDRLLSLDMASSSYILSVHDDIKDRLVEHVIPFASDPFGNYFCFDYRCGPKGSPVVVYWDHEEAAVDPDRALHAVCGTFSELLLMLKTSDG